MGICTSKNLDPEEKFENAILEKKALVVNWNKRKAQLQIQMDENIEASAKFKDEQDIDMSKAKLRKARNIKVQITKLENEIRNVESLILKAESKGFDNDVYIAMKDLTDLNKSKNQK
jgi:predicted DNA-binding WGR domain protein